MRWKRALALISFLLVSCSGADRPLQFNLGNEAVQLDWNRSIDITSGILLDNVMEGLTSYADSLHSSGSDLIRPMPALAFSWSVSEGGRLYRFHLRQGVYWSDGVELEAKHFVDSWQRLLDPRTASTNSYQLFEIENAAAFASGKLKSFGSVGVRAIGPYTLEVRLRRPVPYFLHLVASPSTFPIRKDLIRKFGEQWMDPAHLVTLGPYKIAEWSQGERIVLKAYPSYHGSPPKIGTVICRLVGEPLTAFTFFENGELDVIPRDLPPSYSRRLQSHPDYRSGSKLAVNYLLFNIHRPPFDSAKNRRAFIQAMNRPELAAFFEGAQTPVSSWIPPGLLGHAPELGVSAEGKEAPGFPAKSLVLRFTGSDTWNLVFQSMQRTMAEKLGVKAKLEQNESRDFQKFLALLSSPGRPRAENLPHLLLVGWVADYPDPHSFMNIFTSSSENNYMGWKNAAYDELVEKAVITGDEGSRKRYYLEAQKLLLENEAVLMPLFLSSHQALVRSNLKGVHLNVLDKWYFQNVEFTDSGWRSFSGVGSGMLRRLRNSREGS
ncbi:MAG TPA: peptide ABC transporter substrate-binding protein [Bdellovibrionota bacterium]|jgi:oligopeptide transport system substrate-binding protein